MKKLYKKIGWIIFVIFIFWWQTLSHVTFTTFNLKGYNICENEDYIVVLYQPLLTNAIAFYYMFSNYEDSYYAVAYDRQGHYIGQSTPFYLEHGDASFCFLPEKNDNKIELFHFLQITIDKKSWWSWILQIFHLNTDHNRALIDAGNFFEETDSNI